MHAENLVDGVVELLKIKTAHHLYPTKKRGVEKAPSIYAGFLPEKKYADEEDADDYPFVIVNYKGDEESVEIDSSTVYELKLIIGIYDDSAEGKGWRVLNNLANTVKLTFKTNPILGPFSLTKKMKVTHFEEQLMPFWHAQIDLSFEGPSLTIERVNYGEFY